LVAIAIDWLAINVLEDKKRTSIRREAPIEQPRNAGVRQTSEYLPLPAKSLGKGRGKNALLQYLQGHVLVILAVCTLREVDCSHPAASQFLKQTIVAKRNPY